MDKPPRSHRNCTPPPLSGPFTAAAKPLVRDSDGKINPVAAENAYLEALQTGDRKPLNTGLNLRLPSDSDTSGPVAVPQPRGQTNG